MLIVFLELLYCCKVQYIVCYCTTFLMLYIIMYLNHEP